MNRNNDKLELLGRTFICGEIDELADILTDDCIYSSDYANKRITSAERIKNDIPYTVKAMKRCDDSFEVQPCCNQYHDYQKLDDSEVYIWRQSDKFMKSWLSAHGYRFMESQLFDDCIGYRCNRDGYEYTIYMYACGQEKMLYLDGEYCKKC